MSKTNFDMSDFHWLIDMVQTIDVGLVVLDREYRVHIWNNFMEAHSGINPAHAHSQILFELFPEIPETWLKHKIDVVFALNNRTFTTWEQHPHIFPFKNYRPITGRSKYMYQNMTVLPLASLTGETTHVSLIIYDETDSATNKLESEKLNKKLEYLSHTDGLTQLNNRAYWEVCLEKEFLRFRRTTHHTSLIMIDIDHFKHVNDTYGHPAGDEVIRRVSEVLKKCMRLTDIAGRYGGEEFAMILIDTPAEKAFVFAERLRKEIESQIVYFGADKIAFTISLGIAQASKKTLSYSHWIEAADQALYKSKENGRNQTQILPA